MEKQEEFNLELEPWTTDIAVDRDQITFLTSHKDSDEFIIFTIFLS